MKAVIKTRLGIGNTAYVTNAPMPKSEYKQIVLKVEAAGICGTDVRYVTSNDSNARLKPPVILGHEGSGTVYEVGEGVKDLKVGDRVTVETTFTHCGKCEYCIKGYYNLCIDRLALGSKVNGFFAEYVLCNSDRVHKLPDNVSFEEGALVEPLSCCVHGIYETTSIVPGEKCVIFGAGNIGILCAQLANIAGAEVIVVATPRTKYRFEMLRKYGIRNFLVFGEDNIEESIKEITNGIGADKVVECSGAGKALECALKIVKKLGVVVLLSSPSNMNINLWEDVVLKSISINASISSKPTSWNTSIRLLESKKIDVLPLITHKYSIEDWDDALKSAISKEALKVIIYPKG